MNQLTGLALCAYGARASYKRGFACNGEATDHHAHREKPQLHGLRCKMATQQRQGGRPGLAPSRHGCAASLRGLQGRPEACQGGGH